MRTLTAMFDDRAEAEAARSRLATIGISADDVSIHDQSSLPASTIDRDRSSHDATATRTTSHDSVHGGDGAGIWASIKSFFSGDDEVYEEGLRRGGYLLTARVEDGVADEAIDILDDEGIVDIDERADTWRNEGWTGGSTAGAIGAGGAMGAGSATGSTGAMGAGRGPNAAGTSPSALDPLRHEGDRAGADLDRRDDRDSGDRIIPIIEEQLSVGKRKVARGGVRVRSYMVETPVHEEVRLRQEHVDVERRPVSGESRVRPEELDGLFKEESFEMRETSEEAVVSKTAAVREELAIRRSVDERVETIDDSVRRTEVDVEDLGRNDRR